MHCQWLFKVNDCGNKMYYQHVYGNASVARDDYHAMSARCDNHEIGSIQQDSGSRKAVRRMSILVAHML